MGVALLFFARDVKPGAENQISILCSRGAINELGTGGLLGPVTIYREKD